MSEKRLWDYIREGVGHAGHFDRIESIHTTVGRPDVNYCIDGREGDIELKIYDKRKGGFVIRSSQVAWFRKRVNYGGRCCVVARYDYAAVGKVFLLIPGANVFNLAHDRSFEGWKAQAKHIWIDSINWSELKSALKGGVNERN